MERKREKYKGGRMRRWRDRKREREREMERYIRQIVQKH